MKKNKHLILMIIEEKNVSNRLQSSLTDAGYQVTACLDSFHAIELAEKIQPSLVIVAEKLKQVNSLELVEELYRILPKAGIILYANQGTADILVQAFHSGIIDYLLPSMNSMEIQQVIKENLASSRSSSIRKRSENRRVTNALKRRVDEMQTLARLGHTITASLDLDSVLSTIVSAAVELTGAEEGSLLLLDEGSGTLSMRASRNIKEEFAKTFRLPVNDTLAGNVLLTCQPIMINQQTPAKIKTSYLVHSLIYVPLVLHGKSIGVLGVDNQAKRKYFHSQDIMLLSAIAEYAVIALENAHLYSESIQSNRKLEAVLEQIQDGVIVLDQEKNLLLINHAAKMILSLEAQELGNSQFLKFIKEPDLLELREGLQKGKPRITEITMEDGRIFGTCITPIPGVGVAITMHDITTLKKLDQIKSEFVSTVSHDLRSPLTAIMGYVDLIERAGPINEMQRDFIGRVHVSVQSITSLVDDLLNLSKIEAGFDSRKEQLDFIQLIQDSVESFSTISKEKDLTIDQQLDPIAMIFGNPTLVRQMVDNLVDNAVKYSKASGKIIISANLEENQVILRVKDHGIGIPPEEIPHIFNKFYRASNVSSDISGTGLGMAIVKSIVENHRGRIWVDSQVDHGTCFTVVLPTEDTADIQAYPGV